ncbi:MAG: 2OG-Fe(II) oxygenase [Bacteriovoracia bacterium]
MYFVEDSFYSKAKSLRAHFDKCFSNPKRLTAERFIWDYWNLPGQYTFLRTPAEDFFPKILFGDFKKELISWGKRNLGCFEITPPWLSCYVEGNEQRLHADMPHGPWAYVFSLSPQDIKFSGGQTLILKPGILKFWNTLNRSNLFKGFEEQQIFDEIVPRSNRLVVFDPRIPHGVRRVAGVQNVCEGRLVIHGWFTNPRPYVEGDLRVSDIQSTVSKLAQYVFECHKNEINGCDGILTFKVFVEPSGKVKKVLLLISTLQSGDQTDKIKKELTKTVSSFFRSIRFSKKSKSSSIVIPLVFEAD